ncbi:MAG: hypothetical protein M1433_00795 [Candidatus Parvarchaeota archaeon]|nr:hypothetical protein [Candidatus Parvarchaeota archaeon]
MKITLRKEQKERKKIDKWILFSVVMIGVAIGVGYAISVSITSANAAQQINTLGIECAAYGSQLTNYFAANSTTCLSNVNASLNSSRVCGAVFYCYYSQNCAYAAPVVQNALSCLCDAATSTQVVVSGLCLKQSLS